jgi:hypothetical protein
MNDNEKVQNPEGPDKYENLTNVQFCFGQVNHSDAI